MTMQDNRRLFDITTRNQLYIEGVKGGMFLEFQRMLAELSKELQDLFGRMKYRRLDLLNKAQLNNLLVRLRRVQYRIFGSYAGELVKQIEAFMNANLVVNRRMFGSFFQPPGVDNNGVQSDEDAIGFIPMFIDANQTTPLFGVAAITGAGAALWARLKNLPIPANGVLIANFVKAFSNSAQGQIENIVKQAWANGLTVDELVAVLVGTPGAVLGGIQQGSASQVDRIKNQGRAVIDTVVQFVASGVAAAVASAFFLRYAWNSVLDSATTDICRSRDGKIYEFATGPRPPAHMRCRSHITPLTPTGAAYAAASLGSWLAQQPEPVQKDFNGGASQPLTLAQYESKLALILS
ncbi:MuF-like minor capsid protein [Rhodobacter phage RcMotherGoose]|nr:MuF-like minor capsid protein [Rhodobacter phage RcMotherGoose]